MVTVKYKHQKLYTANSVTKETINDKTCLFSHQNGNNTDCFFVSEWGQIRDAGGFIIENQLTLF